MDEEEKAINADLQKKRLLRALFEDVEDMIGRVGAEYAYAKDLIDQLDEIEEKEPKEALRDLKKAWHLQRWLGRGSRRINESEEKVVADFKAMGKIVPNQLKEKEEKLLEELRIAQGEILKMLSFFEGSVNDDLMKIQTQEQLLDKFGEDGTVKAQAQALLRRQIDEEGKELKNGLDKLIDWMRGLEVILQNIRNLGKEIKKEAA